MTNRELLAEIERARSVLYRLKLELSTAVDPRKVTGLKALIDDWQEDYDGLINENLSRLEKLQGYAA